MSDKILPLTDANKPPKKGWWSRVLERLAKTNNEVVKNTCRH